MILNSRLFQKTYPIRLNLKVQATQPVQGYANVTIVTVFQITNAIQIVIVADVFYNVDIKSGNQRKERSKWPLEKKNV